MASNSHYTAKSLPFDTLRETTRSRTALPEYAVSKLCNILFTKELARGAGKGVTSYALHPGVIASDIWRTLPWPIRPLATLFMKSTDEGARTSLHCATSPDVADHDGRYYDADTRERHPSRLAQREDLARELWEKSEAWTKA